MNYNTLRYNIQSLNFILKANNNVGMIKKILQRKDRVEKLYIYKVYINIWYFDIYVNDYNIM